MPQTARYMTPVQVGIAAILADGRLHAKREFFHLLSDNDLTLDENPNKAQCLGVHMVALRKILRPAGQDIVYVIRGWSHGYQQIRLLRSPSSE